MKRHIVNALLAAALVAAWTFTLAVREDRTRRNRSFMPEMSYSLTLEAQGENAAPFASGERPRSEDGGPMAAASRGGALLPPEGSIPRGHPPLAYRVGKEEAERAGRELKNPFNAAAPALERGAAVFSNYCVVCHGGTGLGDGPVTKSGFPAPPSLLGDSARRMADGRIFHIITFGQGNMPGHAAQIPREDRWKAALHVRTLQQPAAKGPPIKSVPGKAP